MGRGANTTSFIPTSSLDTGIRVGIVDAHILLREGIEALLHSSIPPGEFQCVGTWGSIDQTLRSLPDAAPDVLLLDIGIPPQQSALRLLKALPSVRPGTRVVALVGCADGNCPMFHPKAVPANGPNLCLLTRIARAQPQSDEGGATAATTRAAEPQRCGAPLGIQAVLPKQCSFAEIAQAIRAVHEGEQILFLPTDGCPAQQRRNSSSSSGLAAASASGESASSAASRTISAASADISAREWEVMTLIATGCSNKEIAVELGLAYSTVKNHISSIMEKLGLHDRTQIAVYAISRTFDPESLL